MAKKILIIENEVELVNALSSLLQAWGFETLRALDGASGIAKAKLEKPDLILLDLKMPIMDGLQLAKMLKADSATKKIPIIVTTGVASADLRLMVSELQAVDYIIKPFDSKDLIEKIKKALKSKIDKAVSGKVK